MAGRYPVALLLFCLLYAAGDAAADENWPQWRGPDLNGVAHAAGLPETWSETENIIWKTALPSWSGGTPVIWGDRIFVTSPSKAEDGAAEGGKSLLLLCLSKPDGKVLWERELDTGNELNSKQNASSPSPVTDGTHVWAMTGTGAVAGLTMDGEILWKHNLQTDYDAFGLNFGYGASPMLYDGKIFIEVLRGMTTKEASYVVSFDGKTGNVLWRTERPTEAVLESRDAYTTPVLLRHEGKTQIIVSGGDYVTAYDPETGQEVWRAGGLNPRHTEKNRIIVSPVAVDGLVYATSSRRPMLAVRAGGAGDVTATHVAWTWDKPNGPDVPTPACDGVHLYLLDDRGVISCLNAKTGEVVWGPEHTASGAVSASPLLADGKVYVTNEAAVTTVLAAGPEFKKLAQNTLNSDGRTLSSLAVSGGRIYLRTPTHLYCIGKKSH